MHILSNYLLYYIPRGRQHYESLTIVGFIPVCREGDVRLVNQSYTSTTGLTATGGVVQVCVNREYGYVCADDWDDREAEVVCSSSFGYRAPYFGIVL